MNTSSFTRLARRELDTLEIFTYFVISTTIIFYIDIITPLGLTAWILYFIPLILTLYIKWKYAPFLASGVFILLICISFFLSLRDTSLIFALLNRVFFSLMLIVSAFFIWSYKRKVDNIRMSEERYRYLTEWSPDAIVVYDDGKILYTNPAGLHLLGAGSKDDLIGTDIVELMNPDERDQVRQRIKQAMLGAWVQLPDTRVARLDGRDIRAETLFGGIIWDGRPAIQIILRAIPNHDCMHKEALRVTGFP
jgi:PAS domain S-box-containing protein